MTDNPHFTPSDVVLMCDLTDELAEIYLDFHAMDIVRSMEPSKSELDGHSMSATLGASSLGAELAHVSGIYLFESAHELKSLAQLLRGNQIAGSLEVLSRAAVERCWRVSWLLDHLPEVTSEVRSARIALEVAVSWQHYREVIQSIYPGSHEANKQETLRIRELRAHLEQIFSVIEKPLVDDGQGGEMESPEIRKWTLDGVSYPDYTDLATWAWFGAEDQAKSAKATYKMLCAFSHPSVAASREHQYISDGFVKYRYEISYINKVLSNTVAAFDSAFQSFSSYFDRNFEYVLAHLVDVHERWPKLEDGESTS